MFTVSSRRSLFSLRYLSLSLTLSLCLTLPFFPESLFVFSSLFLFIVLSLLVSFSFSLCLSLSLSLPLSSLLSPLLLPLFLFEVAALTKKIIGIWLSSFGDHGGQSSQDSCSVLAMLALCRWLLTKRLGRLTVVPKFGLRGWLASFIERDFSFSRYFRQTVWKGWQTTCFYDSHRMPPPTPPTDGRQTREQSTHRIVPALSFSSLDCDQELIFARYVALCIDCLGQRPIQIW